MSILSAPDKIVHEQPEARHIRPRDLPALVTRNVQLIGIDAPPASLATTAKTVSVVELPAPPLAVPTLAEVIAEHVVERLHAMGASVAVTGAYVTSPTVTGTAMSAPARSATTALDAPPPILLSTTMAARLLGCSLKALYHRVAERQIPSSCIVRSGRRILFHRERLLAAIERKAGR